MPKTCEKSEKSETADHEDADSSDDSNQPFFRKIAHAVVQDTDAYYDVFSFRRLDCKICHIAVRAAVAREHKTLIGLLANAGAAHSEKANFAMKVAAETNTTCDTQGTIVIRGGWFGKPGERFVVADGVIERPTSNETSSEHPIFVCLNYHSGASHQLVVYQGSAQAAGTRMKRKGTTERWKDKVAAVAGKSSSVMMLCISAALAAELLKIMNVRPFTLFISGNSTGGKTTTTLAAGSVIGLGLESDLHNWWMTDASLEERAEEHSDLPFLIDDLANMEGTPQQLHKKVSTIPYWITSGRKREPRRIRNQRSLAVRRSMAAFRPSS